MQTRLPEEARGTASARPRLAGRRLLIVGAGTRACADADAPPGNGRAMAVLAVREGARVAGVDMDPDALRGTAEHIAHEGGSMISIEANVADADACERIVREAHQQLGGLDGVVLNVGIAAGTGLAGTSAELWDMTFAVNLRGHFLVARAAMPLMEEGGSLVFISSIAGVIPGSRLPAYDASKAGVFGLSRHVALEGARRRIRSNVVVPGLIDTPLGRLATQGRPARDRTPVPLGRQGTAWEVAYATVFLLSNEASYITGQSLIVDGGLSTLLGA